MNPWITSISIFVGSIFFGALLEFFLIDRFKKIAERTKWEGDKVILRAMRGLTLIWFSLIGAYVAAMYSPLSFLSVSRSKKIILIAAIFITAVFVSKLIAGFIRVYTEKISGKFPATSIFTTLTNIAIYSIGLLVILQSLGISITPVLTALGVGGIAVALALQDTLSNLFAGFHILASKSIRPGDYVKLQSGEEGYIADINWRVTSIKSVDHLVIIPNSKIASLVIINYYLPNEKTILRVPVSVIHTSDLKKVEAVTLSVAKEIIHEVDGCSKADEPLIRFTVIGENGINFNVIINVKEYDYQFEARSEFIKRLQQRFIENGIEIATPSRTIINK